MCIRDRDSAEPADPAEAAEAALHDRKHPRHTPRKSGRPSVPSWDDIVFGTKPKDSQT